MPIDRPDGRHWCDPASETPDENRRWTCPCGRTWECRVHDSVWVEVMPEPEKPAKKPAKKRAASSATTEGDES